MMLCNDSTKESSSASELDGAEIVYSKENVAIHPTQFAISGRLKLIKQGSSLFMVMNDDRFFLFVCYFLVCLFFVVYVSILFFGCRLGYLIKGITQILVCLIKVICI